MQQLSLVFLFFFLLWHIWKTRNSSAFELKVWQPNQIVEKARNDARFFKEAMESQVNREYRQAGHHSWFPPLPPGAPTNWIKMNVDWAWQSSNSKELLE